MHDLEDHGLKAKTLDQNRSKIKEGITAVLGQELAARYLFELRKRATSNRTSYRLKLDAGRICIEPAVASRRALPAIGDGTTVDVSAD
jgi:hypothetical protein